MCTCITYENGEFYFGRNLDLDCNFGECVVITPRCFPLEFRNGKTQESHYAMIGMASSAGLKGDRPFPLYAEAVNEKGLCMAGLNFPGNAVYRKEAPEAENVASFELIPWILGSCASIEEAETLLKTVCITDWAFMENLPPAPLHWMLADQSRCLVMEAVAEGLKIYENPFGVLTNNPPFDYHRMNMNNYMNITAGSPSSRFAARRGGECPEIRMEKNLRGGSPKSGTESGEGRDCLTLKPYSQGMGAIGLPGDASSASRFVRAAFLKWNSVSEKTETANVSQFFHILDGVSMVRGTVITEAGTYDVTTYSCCINTRTGTYYYKTYDDSRIRTVDMHQYDLEGRTLLEV